MFCDQTMVSLLLVSALFLALLSFTGWTGSRTEQLTEDLLASADRCLNCVRAGELSDADVHLAALQESWHKHRLFFSATQTHTDMDEVNAALQAAALQLSDNCVDEFYAEIAEIRDTLHKMQDVQGFSFENIL